MNNSNPEINSEINNRTSNQTVNEINNETNHGITNEMNNETANDKELKAAGKTNSNEESGKNTSKNDNWKNDPSLKNMDLKKLAFLSELVSQSGGQSMDSLLPFLISANKNANSMGLQFNDSETNLILNVLKSRMSPEEQSRIEMFKKMADMLGKKG